MAQKSRSAFAFLRRAGLLEDAKGGEATMSPAPRLSIQDLLVNTMPLQGPHAPSQPALREADGCPPPDRGTTREWPDERRATANDAL